ncbi:copper homeostasis protein CutC [Pseudoleptotrichia goodfellowii]|uniref:PF03932 family protein CutC n=2 Tax=Pseudoleptotrichia goodfellowii TaxID=157692 RepID=A0A510JC85_9FUSO|nr:copper homeostasis protein CutC [Pseudoleptotrichia goodfellowii]BBM36061.1 CutC family protein [Pseudoleptotrichia goodfellowii]
MENFTLEICVDSVESAINAEKGGATRLELCSNLIIGGTTPTKSLFEEVKRNVNIPINVLIRPRFGDFLYSEYEINMIKNDIKMFKELGANAVVIGVLTKDGEIDIENMKKLMEKAEGMSVTFHRAFDVCKDPIKAFQQLKELGVKTILTSGQEDSCLKGKELLKKLVELSNGNSPEILIGAGLNVGNAEEMAKYTGAKAFHLSAKKIKESKMIYKKEDVNMGLKEFSEFEILETDESVVREIYEILVRV